jgi:hypothetical protein
MFLEERFRCIDGTNVFRDLSLTRELENCDGRRSGITKDDRSKAQDLHVVSCHGFESTKERQ